MSLLLEYKCPCCGGAISFDPKLQSLKCPYCETTFETETLAAYDQELKSTQPDDMSWDTNTGSEWNDGEADTLRSYTCASCGGEIICDVTTAATSCPFCGNPVIMKGNVSGELKPDIVIPFKLDKNAAKRALAAHYKGKVLMPKIFADENHIEEIKGVYVPFWLFDAQADAKMRYRATRVRTWSDSDYIYTETCYYSVRRDGTLTFEHVPVDGSTKMADDLMESIEPYRYRDAVDFKTAYLAGYLADKYDVSSEQSIDRANERIKKSTSDAIANTVLGYTSVIPENASISLANGTAKYALLPVWLLNTKWEGKNYTFAMNGQTGKFVGDLPLDKKAYRKWLFGLTGAITGVLFALSYLLWLI